MDSAAPPSRIPGTHFPFRKAKDRKGFQGTDAEHPEKPIELGEVIPWNEEKLNEPSFDKFKEKNPDVVGHVSRPYRLEDLIDSGQQLKTYTVSVVYRGTRGARPCFKVAESALAYTIIPIDLRDAPKLISDTNLALDDLGKTIRLICERAISELVDVPQSTQWAIRDAAVRRHGLGPADVDMCLTGARHRMRYDKHYYISTFDILDPWSKTKVLSVKINASRVPDTAVIPKVPAGLRLTTSHRMDRTPSTLVIPASVGPQERLRHERAADLAVYIAYMFMGSYGRAADTRRKLKAVISSFLLPVTRAKSGVRIAVGVARVSRGFGGAVIRPASWVKRSFPGLPGLLIRSPNFLRTYGTMQAMMEVFENGGHLLDVWRRGAQVADIENQRIDRGIRVVQTARCKSADKWHRHPCHACNEQPMCFNMVEMPDVNMRVCQACSERPARELRQDDNPVESVAGRPFGNVVRLILRDFRLKLGSLEAVKESIGERRVLAHQIFGELAKQRLADGWKDSYCFRDIDDVEAYSHFTIRGAGRGPFNASVDAVCLAPGDDGRHGPHVPGNVVVTTWALNSAKGRLPAFVLKALAQYRRAQTHAQLANAFKGLLSAYIIGRMTRNRDCTTPQDRQALRRAWTSGRPPWKPKPSDGLFSLGIPQPTLERHDSQWRPVWHEWLMGQYEQIPAMYGFDKEERELWMLQDPDGGWVPYPFDPESKPFVTWSWWRWHCWVKVRYERTADSCNRGWEMDCDVYTYQLCLMHGHFEKLKADQERLRAARAQDPDMPERPPFPRDGLGISPVPWNAAANSGSVAHRHHDVQMTAGFGGQNRPQNQAAEFQMSECNISLDSYAWNFAVSDFPEDLWPEVAGLFDCLREDDDARWPPGDIDWSHLDHRLRALHQNKVEGFAPAAVDLEEDEEDEFGDRELEELAQGEINELIMYGVEELRFGAQELENREGDSDEPDLDGDTDDDWEDDD